MNLKTHEKLVLGLGSGCGAIGKAIAFNIRVPRFDCRQFYITINCIEKTKKEKKRV